MGNCCTTFIFRSSLKIKFYQNLLLYLQVKRKNTLLEPFSLVATATE